MNFSIKKVKAFAETDMGGNPAGVLVMNNQEIPKNKKQQLAQEAGFSETAFVKKLNEHKFQLDFFTPTKQITHCGHATIASFGYLLSEQLIEEDEYQMYTSDGNSNKVYIRNKKIFLEQRAPKYTKLIKKEPIFQQVKESLGIHSSALDGEPLIVNTGNSFLLVPIADEKTLSSITPDFEQISTISEQLDLVGYYPFVYDDNIYARMFAPWYGIKEEAATGMAAGPLSCYLYDIYNVQQNEFTIYQGHHMVPPSPSTLSVKLNIGSDGSISSLIVGGTAYID